MNDSITPVETFDLRAARFAIYYAPSVGLPWWTEGSRWLGRDAANGHAPSQPSVAGLSQALHGLTVDARRYGWHATLKPPMTLVSGATLDDVRAGARDIAARHARFDVPMRVDVLGADKHHARGFVALRPLDRPDLLDRIDALARDCVTTLDVLRAPPGEVELARRQALPLTPRQTEMLARWGYPYVFDDFRFHLTLSDRVDAADAHVLTEWWQPRVQALGPLPLDGIAIFGQATAGEPFHLIERFALGVAA